MKAAAGALQPSNLDLTQYARARVASREREARKMRGEDAAGALGFSALGWRDGPEDDAEHHEGDPLTPLLIRLKYAGQANRQSFTRALELLLFRHAPEGKPISRSAYSIALAALFEWIYNECPKCRGPEARRRRGGAICLSCRGRGVRPWKTGDRWMYVSDFLRTEAKRRGGRGGMSLQVFTKNWLPLYRGFLSVLARLEKNFGTAIDTQVSNAENAHIESGPVEVDGWPTELADRQNNNSKVNPPEPDKSVG